MFCSKCQAKFDAGKYTPKLLVMCGHTLCENCCYQLHKNGKIQCFQCKTNTFTDKITSLPKNLALIADQTANHIICSKHSKKYQAFCSNEKMLICIQCILQDGHKNHQMNSIPKSYQVQHSFFSKKVQKVQHYLREIQNKAEQNLQMQNQLQKRFQIQNNLVKQTFEEVKQIIQEQQLSLKQQIYNSFKSNDNKFVEKRQFYHEKLQQTQQKLFASTNVINLPEIQFLDRLACSQQTLNLIKFNSFENIKPIPSLHTKNSILELFIKTLNSLKENIVTSNGSHVTSISLKNQKNTSNEPLRGFRKAAFSNMPSCQNTKPQKKFSCKKQSISHQVQAPPLKSIDREKVLKPTNHSRPTSSHEGLNQKKTIRKIDIVESVNTEISAVDPKESLCSSFLSNMTSFMSEKRQVYILGGFNQDNNNIIKLDLSSMNYQEVSKMNANRSKFGTIFVDKKLYIFGGKRGKQRLSDVQVFDIQKQTFSKVGSMSKSRSGFGVAFLQDQIYLIGGNDGENILNTVEAFNIKTKQWKKLPSMNESRDQLAVIIANNDRIYAIGGFGGPNNEPLRSSQYFDLRTKQWKLLPKMKYARRALSAADLADGIYAIGGFDGASYMSQVQKFDNLKNEWIQVASMNVARCTHSSIAVYQSQQIYVFGGFDFLPLSTVQKYSPINDQWQLISEMPNARFMHSSILVKDSSR